VQYARGLGTVIKVDAHTVEFKLERPNPVLLDHMEAVAIMSQTWAREHGVGVPLSLKNDQVSHARHHANGTGPYRLVRRQPDVETVLARFEPHWQRPVGNVTELVFVPLANATTRTAALLKDEVDLINTPARGDLERLEQQPGITLMRSLENRVVFLGMDQHRQELLYSDIKGRNPFKDLHVRQALAHALDLGTLQRVVWRDEAVPTGCMLPSAIGCQAIPELDQRIPAFDTGKARQLLERAGYEQGFEVTLDCPNDRGMNDEALCVAMSAMWARVGIRTKVQTMPRAQYFPKLERYDTSLYLLSWGGADIDAQPTMDPLMHSANGPGGAGADNYGRFSDPTLDALINRSGGQNPSARRSELVKEALLLHQAQHYHLVLLRQKLTWAVRDRVRVKPAANNHVRAWFIQVDP
jgi:peptide/nickel transport system substrate-binding protein